MHAYGLCLLRTGVKKDFILLTYVYCFRNLSNQWRYSEWSFSGPVDLIPFIAIFEYAIWRESTSVHYRALFITIIIILCRINDSLFVISSKPKKETENISKQQNALVVFVASAAMTNLLVNWLCANLNFLLCTHEQLYREE